MKQVKETIEIKAGEKMELLRRSFSSVPMTYEFTASTADDSELVGRVELHATRTLRGKQVKSVKLQAHNSVKASMWDTFFTIFVVAENELHVTLPQRKLGSLSGKIVIISLIITMAAALIIEQQ